MRVIIRNKHEAYWEMYEHVTIIEHNPSFAEERGYSEKGIMEFSMDYFERLLKENNIPNCPYEEEECEMVHVNYDSFECVLLHDDGRYTKRSLGDVILSKQKEDKI